MPKAIIKMILTNAFNPDIRVYKEARYLVSQGFDVEILCWDRESEFPQLQDSLMDGIRIRRFYPKAHYGTGLKQLNAYIRYMLECREYLTNKAYDFLHCHDLDGIIVGWFVVKQARLVFDMHEFYEVNGKSRQRIRYLVRQFVKFFQDKSDFIVHVDENQIVPIHKSNRHKLVHLPNYPEEESFPKRGKSLSNQLRISYIGAVRQYTELKNLFDACRGMTDVEITIHGAGIAYEALNSISQQYSNVRVTGRYHPSESARLYNEVDLLYVMYPATCEQNLISYPIKFFEAIITNTPLIVSEGTVMAEFVRAHNIGFVVNGDSVDDIRRLVDEVRTNRKLLIDKASNLKKIQFNYTWKHVVTNLDKIYKT